MRLFAPSAGRRSEAGRLWLRRDPEQRRNRTHGQRFHGAIVVFDCGQKRQSLAHFLDQRVNNRGSALKGGAIMAWRERQRSAQSVAR